MLLVARTRYALPLSHSLERKFDALGRRLHFHVLASSVSGQGVHTAEFTLVGRRRRLDGVLFWLLLPWRVRAVARRERPDAILAQSPYEAAAALVARTGVPVVVELHGDWRTATRLYGAGARRLMSPVADAVASWAVRRASGIRTLSAYTTALVRELGREPDGEFFAFMDLDVFRGTPPVPPPLEPVALFVGVLEAYKDIDGLAASWRRVAPRVPGARLHLVGSGSRREVAERLVADLPEQTTWNERLSPAEVAAAMDASTFLVLPSRSEGLGRVVVEAFCRGRPVLATRVGGIPDLVRDGVNGVLVEGADQLDAALERLLRDQAEAARLGAAAAEGAPALMGGPDDYAAAVEALVRPYTVRP